MECFGKRLSPLMRFSAVNFEERRVSLFLEQVEDENEGEMNMMRKNNIIKKDRHISRNLKDDDAMLFCFVLFREWKQWMCI
jgi:hypothetical protein